MAFSQERLFVYEPEKWAPHLERNYVIDSPAEVREYDNAIILPMRYIAGTRARYGDGLLEGGVCTSSFEHIAGQRRSYEGEAVNKECLSSYKVEESAIADVPETVIYGGMLTAQFGHMLCDGLSRLWYPATKDTTTKVAFTVLPKEEFKLWDILALAGIPQDRVLIVEQPTRFSKVVVPDETSFSLGKVGYRKEWLSTIHTMRENAGTANTEKVYFTRTQLKFSGCVGEDYFEEAFRAQGYEIVAPETLSFKEQVALVAGAKEFAATMGSISLHAMFANPEQKLTILNRSAKVATPELMAAHAGGAETTLVDAYASILPEEQAGNSIFLLADNPNWRSFMQYKSWQSTQGEYPLADNLLEYVKMWGEHYSDSTRYRWVRNNFMTNVVYRINHFLLNEEVDVSNFPKPSFVEDALQRVNELEEELSALKSQEPALEEADAQQQTAEPYGNKPKFEVREFKWTGEDKLSIAFTVKHPWAGTSRMRTYLICKKRLSSKFANKVNTALGKVREVAIRPLEVGASVQKGYKFIARVSFTELADVLELEPGNHIVLYLRFVCDEPQYNSQELFGRQRPTGSLTELKARSGIVGNMAFNAYEDDNKYIGFKVLSIAEAQERATEAVNKAYSEESAEPEEE